ncbi:zinc ribbon domain-containing protein [Maribacter arcticus]|uniref:Putative zinc ribbon domain-containing protein n=1 Tax=Maribacter arcticus TaxID=561365 RepID=A0A1T4ZTP1_9FLAO|nr:zinc ribbon domain-containing protein [Maribacter arcticus]SKB26154.1 Putative zinc ribbon domain-containing protein [Maribacter arcticus]
MKPSLNICQSCGMPMHHLSDFGTNKNGTVNSDYCHFCYVKGAFVDHGITLEQKIEKNIAFAEKKGMPREEATILAHSTLPNLRRWKGLKPLD